MKRSDPWDSWGMYMNNHEHVYTNLPVATSQCWWVIEITGALLHAHTLTLTHVILGVPFVQELFINSPWIMQIYSREPPPQCHFFQGAGPCQYKEILTYIPGMGGIGVGPLHSHKPFWTKGGTSTALQTVGRWSEECIGWYLYLERRYMTVLQLLLNQIYNAVGCSIDAVYVYVHVCMHRCMCKGSIMILGSFVQVSKHASWHIQFLAYEWFKQKVRY